ncbi:hypothetical protein [Phascolarctobacterium faecium]
MKKEMLKILVVATSLMLAGCSGDSKAPEKTGPAPTSKATAPAVTEKKEKTTAEKWALIDKEFKAEMGIKDFYPFVVDAIAQRDEDKKEITFTAVLQPKTKPADALDFADTMIRRYADLARTYLGKDYKSGSKDYYGGLFDDYNAMIIIAPDGAKDPDDCFVFDHIMQGMHTKQPIELTKKYSK